MKNLNTIYRSTRYLTLNVKIREIAHRFQSQSSSTIQLRWFSSRRVLLHEQFLAERAGLARAPCAPSGLTPSTFLSPLSSPTCRRLAGQTRYAGSHPARFLGAIHDMAERAGFEPAGPLPAHLISSQAHSAALPPLRSISLPQRCSRGSDGKRNVRCVSTKCGLNCLITGAHSRKILTLLQDFLPPLMIMED